MGFAAKTFVSVVIVRVKLAASLSGTAVWGSSLQMHPLRIGRCFLLLGRAQSLIHGQRLTTPKRVLAVFHSLSELIRVLILV